MGRYDKIKVWNGSAWVQPSRIRVRANNAWQDFGDNLSDNTRTLEVRNNNAWHRCTLNRSTRTIPGETYSNGAFSLLPAYAFGYNNYSGASDFKMTFTARKTSDTNVVLFYSHYGTAAEFKIEWLANGSLKFTVATSWEGTTYVGRRAATATTTKKVTANTWMNVQITAPKGTYNKFKVVINGESQTFTNLYYFWEHPSATNTVGQAGVQFKDEFFIQAQTYVGKTTRVTIDMNTASGSGNNYTGITHVDTSTTEVIWI